jgi:ribosomal protein S18 acetylase RimI-like enzyme
MASTFRPATALDLPTVLGLLRDFYAEESATCDAQAEAALLALLQDPGLGRVFVILDEGDSTAGSGLAVGYLVVAFGYSLEFRGRDAFVDELYVAPPHRGRGLGREALRVAEDCCRQAGVRALHLEVRPDNARARRLYAGEGYADREYYLMSKKLQ